MSPGLPVTARLIVETGVAPERSAPPPERILRGQPEFETWSSYESADGKSFAGVWRATPGKWRIYYDEWEYCDFLEGVSVVAADDGQSWILKAGDRFVIEPGFAGSWEVLETTVKRYVIRLP
jgi:uncharacterized cupin superfamily protein